MHPFLDQSLPAPITLDKKFDFGENHMGAPLLCRLETGKHHLVSEECALSYAWAFLLWTFDYSGEDPVLAQFSRLALQLCSLQHTIFELSSLSLPAHRLQRCYDAMFESLVMKLIDRKEHSTKVDQVI